MKEDGSYSPEAEYFYIPVLAQLAVNTFMFAVVQTCLKRDNSWIDAMWSVQFSITNLVVWALRGFDTITPRMFLITVPVFLWTLRLSLYIVIRHRGEDYRYKEMREGWDKAGRCGYYAQAYIFVYVMQLTFMLFNNSSVLFVNLYADKETSSGLMWSDFIGLFIWFAGFTIEVMSDAQLANHLKNPAPGTGKFIKSGFWRYSRHPNYFGEAVMWWGLWIVSLGEAWGWVTVYSAIFITLLIRFVSGVPFPEKKYENNPEWQQYCKETNCFALWPYKKAISVGEQVLS